MLLQTEAERCGMYYVNERWLRWYAYKLQDNPEQESTDLKEIEAMAEDGTFDVLPKKEVIELKERTGISLKRTLAVSRI